MRYTKYPELKAELKDLAKEIRQFKFKRDHWYDFTHERPNMNPAFDQGAFQYAVQSRARDFRHLHIAYCMLRGRTYEQIENYCHEAPDFDRIQRIKWEHGNKTLRACA